MAEHERLEQQLTGETFGDTTGTVITSFGSSELTREEMAAGAEFLLKNSEGLTFKDQHGVGLGRLFGTAYKSAVNRERNITLQTETGFFRNNNFEQYASDYDPTFPSVFGDIATAQLAAVGGLTYASLRGAAALSTGVVSGVEYGGSRAILGGMAEDYIWQVANNINTQYANGEFDYVDAFISNIDMSSILRSGFAGSVVGTPNGFPTLFNSLGNIVKGNNAKGHATFQVVDKTLGEAVEGFDTINKIKGKIDGVNSLYNNIDRIIDNIKNNKNTVFDGFLP